MKRHFEEIWDLKEEATVWYNPKQSCRPLYKIDANGNQMDVWLTIDVKNNVSFETMTKGVQLNYRTIVRWQLPAHLTQRMLIEIRANLSELVIPNIIKNSTIEWSGRYWFRNLDGCALSVSTVDALISNYTEEADNEDGKEFCRLADCEYCNAWGEA